MTGYYIENNIMRAVGMCIWDVENRKKWRCGQRWPIPNSWEEGEGEGEEEVIHINLGYLF